ncbi:unnamed protein product [Effrenium voratum]|nr:unnamed protein product [Effrenium voratum]
MVRRMFARLAALSFLAAGHALVVCPSTMGAGETHYCFSSSPEASLQLVGSEVVATAIADAGNKGLYALTVPENLSPGNYSVKEAGGSASSKVRIGGPSTLLLRAADKALYKPGQTARFRALALSTGRLRPQQRNLTFEVSSPEGFKLLKASSSTDETGVAQFQFPIAQEPLLGPHVARVLVDSPVAGAGAIAEANFGIEEYVLPRFEVSVAMDQSYLTVGSSAPSSLTLSGKVSANFTFGEPVLGTCTLVLWTPLPSWEAQPSKDGGVEHKMLASLAGLTLLEGKASFQLSVPRDKLRAGYGVIAEATVVYAATGERQSGTGSVSVRYQGNDLRAAVKVTDGSQVFRPGLPSQLEVKLSKPDGQVPALEDLEEMVLVATSSTVDWSKGADPVRIPLAAASFKEGLQVVEVPMAKESLSCCDPSASRTTWDEHQKACGCCVSAVNFRVERKVASQSYFQGIYEAPEGESSSACLGRGYSPSGHFLSLGEPTQVDGAWSVLLRSTQPELTDLEYLVTQAGALVASGSGAISLTSRGTFWEGSLPLALPAVSGELGVLVMAKSGTASLAASTKLSRPPQLAFNLTAGFSAQEVKPGEALTVQVQAGTTETGAVPSTARAFLASLDRSAELLGSRAAISRSAIFEALKGAAEGKEPTPVAGKPWRHCGIHGEELMVAAELPEEIQVVQIGQVGSDDAVFGQPLGDHCPRPLYDGMVCSSGGGGEAVDDMMMVPMMAMAEGAAAPVMKHNEEATADAGAADTTGSAAVRTFFPETWIWTDIALEPGGQRELAGDGARHHYLVEPGGVCHVSGWHLCRSS